MMNSVNWRGAAALLGGAVLCAIVLAACATAQPADVPAPKAGRPADEKLPLTMANLRGHKALYNEGWFIVTSSRDALRYAHEHAITSSGEALAQAQRDLASRNPEARERMGAGLRSSVDTAASISEQGARGSARIREATNTLATRQYQYGVEQLERSWSFVTGGIYYGKRTPEHLAALKATWSTYYGDVSADWHDVDEFSQRLRDRMRPSIEADWDGAWHEASSAFKAHYEASGDAPNTLVALGDLFAGYAKAFFVGAVKPAGRSAVEGTAVAAQGTTYLFTPVADFVYTSGRTVQATGLTVYYVGATSVDLMAPSVESAYLTGLGLLSLGSSSATYLGGQSLGLANQVAMSVAGGVTGAAEAGIRTSAEAARYAALVTYDVGRAGTRVVINQAQSGAVLGYNALTQIPVQLFMGTFTGAIFLVEEGSTLKVVRATDKPSADGASKAGPTLSDLPVGTVVDMQKLKERKDIEIEVVTDDPEVTHKVLEQVQQDARAP